MNFQNIYSMKLRALVFAILFMIAPSVLFGQLLINEIQVTNLSTLQDEDGEYEDWFELYNAGSASINLSDYFVSDKLESDGDWQLPNSVLYPDQRAFVFASGKDRSGMNTLIDHMESPVYPWSWWTYLTPGSQPSASWNDIGFNDSSWGLGPGGFGFGDGDDGTDLGGGILSVYSRTTFNLNDASDVGFMALNVDYDDAFVCYLNGVEIARANIGTGGVEPTFNTPADQGHEATAYQGILPEYFIIDYSLFNSLLVSGENVIALQVHNADIGSSDLTGSVYVLLGMLSDELQTEIAPDWIDYNAPFNHADFGLSAGETLYIKNSAGEVLDSKLIDSMQSDQSLRRTEDGGLAWCFTTEPTPGTENEGECLTTYEPFPTFSVESGVYPVPVYITIGSANPNAEIYITFDGSAPDQNDLLYTGGIAISGSAVVSARAYSNTALPSPVEKNTYMIGETEIDLPIVSVSTEPANLWDPVTGIHVFGPEDYDQNVPYFGANFWEDWEREAYVEYFDGDHVKQMEGPVGIKIHGGWSRSNVQKSFRIQAKGKYGMESMDYPLIEDKPFISSFKGFNLRNGGNSYWEHRFHEALIERTCRNTHADYMAYTPSIVFLNGEYWGYMEIRENLDQHYVSDNHDIGSSDATVVSANYLGFNVINGDPQSFFNLHEYATTTNVNDPSYFQQIGTMLDIENYTDYIIAETYWANGDWSNGWQNNTKLWHDDRPGGKWRFMLMDMDFGMGLAGASPYDDYINTAGDEGYLTDQLFGAVIQNEEFRTYFINRYADLINTEYQIDKVTEMAYEMRDEVVPVFQRHAQRWGTYADAMNGSLEPRLDWAEQRVQGARDVVQNHFGLVEQVDITLDVLPAGAGRIQISTIELDEAEYPWTGVYYQGNPVRITVYENPGYTFSHWAPNYIFSSNNTTRTHTLNFTESMTFTAVFAGAAVANPISITEMMFDPDSQSSSGDWIEIHNNTNVAVNLSNWKIRDSNHFNVFEFADNTFIGANEYMIMATDDDAFEQAYPSVTNVVGPMLFSLGNMTDQVSLIKPNGEIVISYTYSDQDGYDLLCSAGCGHSRGHLPTVIDYSASQWYLECENGSPGEAFVPCEYPVMLSEINYNSSSADDSGDWIELHNSTDVDMDISGWSIRDDNDNVFVVPAGTTLEAGEYLVVVRSVIDFESVYPITDNYIGPSNLAFGNNGDMVKIYNSENELQVSTLYKAVAPWSYLANGLGYTLEYIEASNAPCKYSSWFAGCELGSPARSYDPNCGPLVTVNETSGTLSALVYPNPTQGILNIDNSAYTLSSATIYDMQGKIVVSHQFNIDTQWQYDTSELANGIYTVQFRGESGDVGGVRLVVW
jgi:hypothetical protein